MKKFNIFFIILLLFTFSACEYQDQNIEEDDQDIVYQDTIEANIKFAPGDNENSVTKDITLPTTGERGSEFTWLIGNMNNLSLEGHVTRPYDSDKKVSLRLISAYGSATSAKVFTIIIKKW